MSRLRLSLCALLVGLAGCVVEGDWNLVKFERRPAAGIIAGDDQAQESDLILEVPDVAED